MNRNFWIPFVLIATVCVFELLSGETSLAVVLPVLLIGVGIAFIGYKTDGDWGSMMLWGLPLLLMMFLLMLGLGWLAEYVPWLNAILEWPMKP